MRRICILLRTDSEALNFEVDGLQDMCDKFGGYTFMSKILFEYRV